MTQNRGAIGCLSLVLAACIREPRSPDGRIARGGMSIFVEPTGGTAILFAGQIAKGAYDYDAMAAQGLLGCMKDRSDGLGLARGVRLVDAGALEAKARSARVVVPFDPSIGLHLATWSPALFAEGELVSVQSAGSTDAPPFTVATHAPLPVALVAPSAGSVVERASGIALAWAPAPEGFVDVLLKTGVRTWACVFPRARGAAVISGRLFEDEPSGPITLAVAGLRTASGIAAGWHVSLTVASARSETVVTLR